MKFHKDIVLSFVFKESSFDFYKLKTIRGTNIFFDNQKNFYGSWDDLWHVLKNLSAEKKYHWSHVIPKFIAKDYRRLILGYLNKHKSQVGLENYGLFHEFWAKWETLLFEDGSTVELDISAIKNPTIKSISLEYEQLLKQNSINEVLANFFDSKNHSLSIVNLSSGKKFDINEEMEISNKDIIPGDLLKLNIK